MGSQNQQYVGPSTLSHPSANISPNISGYYQQQQFRGTAGSHGYNPIQASAAASNSFVQQLEREKMMSVNKFAQNYALTKNTINTSQENDSALFAGQSMHQSLSVQQYE